MPEQYDDSWPVSKKSAWFAKARAGARHIHQIKGSKIVGKWLPSLGGRLVRPSGETGEYETRAEAVEGARRFKSRCANNCPKGNGDAD